MSNPSLVSTATEADWTFTTNRAVMSALEAAARKAAREFNGVVDFDDARQDALLWLAVRPGEVGKYTADRAGMRSLSQNIYANALRAAAVGASRTVSRGLGGDL